MTEQTIFLTALDLPDPGERTAYLDRACANDPALRRQVEALLTAHEKSGLFLDEPALEQAAGRGGGPNARTVSADEPPGPDTPTLTSPNSARAGGDDLGFLQPPTRPDSLGRLDRYEVLEVLGRGGFGTVLRAFDDRLHRVVAIKVLAPQLATSGTARARFHREARAGAAVRDEHVVNIYEVSEPDAPVPYLVMEYVAGQTLQQKLDRTGPLSVPEILRIGSQIAKGLAAAHTTGLIHRDVKPSNILLENGVERVKLTDFGLARAADDASISHSGVVAGTPQYMAPEQAQGIAIDHRADLFSLGSVLYAMCTGRPPFRATTTMAVLKRVCEEDPRPIREVNPETPDWLAAVIARLHAKKREDRFQSAKEVAELLQQHLAHLRQPNLVPPPPVVVSPSPSPRRWQAGDRVLAPWEPEWLYPATVQQANADSVQVAYDDGDSDWLNAAAVRSLDIEQGARVFGWWNGPYYPGTVTERDGDRVHIAYDDGDSEWTDLSYIRVAATRTVPVERTPAAPRRRRRLVRAGLLLALLIGAGLGGLYVYNKGPSNLYRYLSGDALVRIAIWDPNLERVAVTRDGQPVGVIDSGNPSARLAPGRYDLEMVTRPGFRPAKVTYDTRGVGATMTSFIGGRDGHYDLILYRGDEFRVFVTTEPVPASAGEPGRVQLFSGKDLTGGGPPASSLPTGQKSIRGPLVFLGIALVVLILSALWVRRVLKDKAAAKAAAAALGNVGRAERRKRSDAPGGPRPSRRGPRRRWKRAAVGAAGLLAIGAVLLFMVKRRVWWDPLWGVGEVVIVIRDPDTEVHIGVLGPDWPYDPIRGPGYHRVRLYAGENRLSATKIVRGESLIQFLRVNVVPGDGHIVTIDPRKFRPQPYAKGWVPLYNGRDLKGWTPAPAVGGLWQGDRGTLRGSGAAGLLVSEKEYSDFRLWCVCRVNPGGESGILYRFDTSQAGGTAGYEARIGFGGPTGARTGTLTDPRGRTLTATDAGVKPDEWFSYEVIARGDRHQLRVNGRLVLDWVDADRQRARGHVALRLADPKTVAWFDVVDIEEQSADSLTEPDSQEERNRARVTNDPGRTGGAANGLGAGGFIQVFNGKDLTGWKAHPDHPGPWSVKDGILRGAGAKGHLLSTAEYGDFHLKALARVNGGGDGAILFRGDKAKLEQGQARGYAALINATIQTRPRTGSLVDTSFHHQVGKDPLVKPGEWFTYEVIAQGYRLQLKVNGQTTLDWTDGNRQRAGGHLALQLANDKAEVEFKSIEVKELPAAPAKPDPPGKK